MKYRLKVNGESHSVAAEPGTPLLWVLREGLGLTGTKFGCGVAQCGACTVHLGDTPVRSCVLAVEAVGNKEITTIEGVGGPIAAAVQESWKSIQVPQCGYCQSGQIMTTIALLDEIEKPTDDDIDGALTGNICRCATYPRIRRAVHEASAKLRS
jgi:isoquinoline 1-oxidoreductase alpha subunit